MKKYLTFLFILALTRGYVYTCCAQVGINTDGSQPAPSAILDVKSTSKGFLPPRMTSDQRDAIPSPEKGLVIFNLDCNDLQFFNGSSWVPVSNAQLTGSIPGISGNHTPCINATGEIYTATDTGANPYATGYNWAVPSGATITSGQGTATITVNFGTQSGYIYINSYDNCWKSRTGMFRVALGAPDPPPQSNHIPYEASMVWTWNKVYGATGY